MSSQVDKLNSIPIVDIDSSGVFKYVLIEVTGNDGDPDDLSSEVSKLLVRGYAWAKYHANIYDKIEEEVRSIGLDAQCLGGGRIKHNPEKKALKVYGYSYGFGRADHTKTVEALKTKYPDYDITWTNEGY